MIIHKDHEIDPDQKTDEGPARHEFQRETADQLGGQKDARITPDELAELAETIPYEIMLGFGARIPVEVVD